MKALGFEPSKDEQNAILNEHGTFSGSNRRLINMENFVRVMAPKILTRDPNEEIERAYMLFVNGKGEGGITVDDLRRVTRELGESLEEEEIKAMIDEFDVDGDGESKFLLLDGRMDSANSPQSVGTSFMRYVAAIEWCSGWFSLQVYYFSLHCYQDLLALSILFGYQYPYLLQFTADSLSRNVAETCLQILC